MLFQLKVEWSGIKVFMIAEYRFDLLPWLCDGQLCRPLCLSAAVQEHAHLSHILQLPQTEADYGVW